MNKRLLLQIREGLLAIALTGLIFYFYSRMESSLMPYYWAVFLWPLLRFALRHGAAAAGIYGGIAGLVCGMISIPISDWLSVIVFAMIPFISVLVMGFFAKYTQKTLNNRRYSSTSLNIITGALLSNVLFYFLRFYIGPLAMGQESPLNIMTGSFWISSLVMTVVVSLLFITIAKLKPSFLIPKRSKYLSRKETSALLND
ncbi:hypothetical protein [Facklamia hominis]|uniref:Uncharacterized protein n=1 Tax=Facklamia hominis TaxID=178214 RepID=A0AAJ1Q535_9LACT|nr:hypothetical protein [Facklamia hominis]MDK7186686.1 hypothetical protein [Facklamia hominis]